MQCDLLLTGARLLPIRPGRQVIFPGSVAIRGRQIAAVGDSGAIDASFSAAEIIDCGGKLVMPGFVDCHVHAGMGLPKAGLSGLPAAARWKELVEPRLRALGEEETFAAVSHSCLELIRAGVTAFADICINAAATADAVKAMGLRALIAPAGRERALLEKDIRTLQAYAGDGIEPAIGIASGATVPDEMPEGMPIHLSAAELDGENLARLGLLTERTILAHGTQSAARAVLGAGGGVVCNPSAEGRQATARIAACRDNIGRVGFGTQDPDAGGRHDMFEEMRLAVLSSRLDEASSPLDAWDALEMATLGGASVLGMGGRLGSLEAGKQADMILIDLGRTHFAPLPESAHADVLAAHLVFSAGVGDVDSVIVAGRPLMRGGRLTVADEGRIVAAARDAVHREGVS
jgi:5-methylthioadenosine/S-adenosylhomocysteine deaminase